MRHLITMLIILMSACAGDREPSRLTVGENADLRAFATIEPDAVRAMLPVPVEARVVAPAHRVAEHDQVVETVLCYDGAPDRALDSVASRFDATGWQPRARNTASARWVHDRWDAMAIARSDDACPGATTIAIAVVQHR
jgi:hypothetical protein